jgi:hypothetical protein
MATPGQSSGTQTFFLSNTELTFEAFDRCQVRPSEITRHYLLSARRSMNLELQAWSNKGINLWEMVQAQLTLVAGQATYPLPANLVTITEMYFSTVNANGAGFNSDRIMIPITRTQYAMVPNKLQPGQPTQYWLQRMEAPVITIWQPPFQGGPAYTINYNYLSRIDDVGLATGETPDVPYRALEALCCGLTKRLAKKFAPAALRQQIVTETTADALDAWNDFITNDQEDGPMIMQPNVGGYGRMRGR